MVEHYDWGTTTNGLRLAVATVKSEYRNHEEELSDLPGKHDDIEFRVALQNVGDKDLVLDLGSMIGNGPHQCYSTMVTLSFTDSSGVTNVLKDNCGRRPGVAGRMDHFVAPLPIGCTYILKVSFDNYWFSATNSSLKPGEYQVKAMFEGKAVTRESVNTGMEGLKLLRYWTGKAESGTIQLKVE